MFTEDGDADGGGGTGAPGGVRGNAELRDILKSKCHNRGIQNRNVRAKGKMFNFEATASGVGSLESWDAKGVRFIAQIESPEHEIDQNQR